MNTPAHATRVQVDYFDGQTARAHRASMWIEEHMLQLQGHDLILQVPLGKVRWPERTRQGIRVAHFADGGSVQSLDASAWDNWARAQNLGEPMVVRAQQSWRWTWLATVVLLLVGSMAYWWGLPAAARVIAPWIPHAVDKQIGQTGLQALDDHLLEPSALPAATQQRWRQRFAQALHREATWSSLAEAGPALTLHFRKGRIGPNALALPDGSIVVTDELVALLQDREDVLLGVLGHEAGHVRLRHSMRELIQTTLLGAATSVALGDFSALLSNAPVLLGHMAYSRDLEREADDMAIHFLRANGIRPSVMAVLFERLAKQDKPAPHDQGPSLLGIAFSSHPADAERVAHFRAADLAMPATQPASTH